MGEILQFLFPPQQPSGTTIFQNLDKLLLMIYRYGLFKNEKISCSPSSQNANCPSNPNPRKCSLLKYTIKAIF